MSKKTNTLHALIISDLHLGSAVGQPKKVEEMLRAKNFHKLILLGDIFDSLDFRDLTPDCWSLLHYIGELSKTCKIRWIEGNHDMGLSNIFSALLGAKVFEEYVWQHKGKKYLAIHGHQFDRFLVDNAAISYVASAIYLMLQKIDFKDKRFSRFVKKTSKGWLRLSHKVFVSAVKYGRERGVGCVFCGHTHKAEEKLKQSPTYYNAGCWTDLPCTYITIDDEGIRICEY
jgi:UDP-2,3-diacylglucosamine pyrophosphatase LpxH